MDLLAVHVLRLCGASSTSRYDDRDLEIGPIISFQWYVTRNSSVCPSATLAFLTKRDPTLFPTLKNDHGFDSWDRGTIIQAKVQGVAHVLDKDYIPATPDDIALFELHQGYMYSVFEQGLLTDIGKSFVQEQQHTHDAQKVYANTKEHYTKSMNAMPMMTLSGLTRTKKKWPISQIRYSTNLDDSKLHKRHNALSYHRVREAIAYKMVGFHHIPGVHNPAEILSKHWAYGKVWSLLQPLMFWEGDTADIEHHKNKNKRTRDMMTQSLTVTTAASTRTDGC